MRHLILFSVLLLCASPALAAKNADGPAKAKAAVQAMKDYCLPALKANQDPAEFALQQKLIEFPPEQAMKFSPDGGRVFAIPSSMNNAVMMTSKNYQGICNIAVHEAPAKDLWAAIDAAFDSKSGFSLMREKYMAEQHVTKREFAADLGGPLTLLITASDKPRPGGLQALMTAARVAPKK